MSYIEKIKADIEKHSQRYLWDGIALFILLFAFLVLKKYYYFGYNISDLAIFNQTFFNTLQGRWFEETITLNNYFADHFSPILILLLPFYALKQSAVTLLLIQVVVTALCAWPLFLIAKRLSNNELFATFVAYLWLVNPFVQRQVMYEFHVFHLMVFLFFWAFYFYQGHDVKRFIFFSILTLLTREDSVFLFFGLAILTLLDHKPKKWFINIFFCSLVYFIGAIFFINISSEISSYKFINYYNWLGGDSLFSIVMIWASRPIAVLRHIFTPNNIFIIFYLFLNFLFIPFFAKRFLFLSSFVIMQYIMIVGGIKTNHINMHYVMAMLPGIFLAYIYGMWAIFSQKISARFSFIFKYKFLFSLIFIFSIIYFGLIAFLGARGSADKLVKNYRADRIAVSSLIPEGASICVNPSMMSHLSSRQFMYHSDYAYYGEIPSGEASFFLPSVDYVFLDMSDFLASIIYRNKASLYGLTNVVEIPDRWLSTLSKYNLIMAKDNVMLWQNKDLAPEKNLPYFELIQVDSGDQSFIKNWSLEKIFGQRVLKVTYNKLPSNNYFIRFYQSEKYWDTPFDYGLYSLAQKKAGRTVTAYYYISDEVDSFEVYHYKGYNVLGEWSNLELFLKKDRVFGPINFSTEDQ